MRRIVPVLFLLVLAGCSFSARYESLVREVDARIVPMEDNRIPQVLVDGFADKKVFVIGEEHYVQEQQEFLVSLLPSLYEHGYRLILIEDLHAYGWIAEDYVLGSIDDIPPGLKKMNGFLLEGVRRFNSSLPMDERIRVQAIDMNHQFAAFSVSLGFLRRRIEAKGVLDEIFGPVTSDLAIPPDRSGRLAVLESLKAKLDSEKDRFQGLLTPKWYARLGELVEVEIISSRLRKKFDDKAREKLITLLTDRRIAETPGRVVLHCGMTHAQKRPFRDVGQTTLAYVGEHIRRNYSSHHVACFGVRGKMKKHFYDKEWKDVNRLVELPKNDLLRTMAEKAGGRVAVLPLNSPVFSKWTKVCGARTKPSRQFDAYVLFPTKTPLRSMVEAETRSQRVENTLLGRE
jgi:hypothetical protein